MSGIPGHLLASILCGPSSRVRLWCSASEPGRSVASCLRRASTRRSRCHWRATSCLGVLNASQRELINYHSMARSGGRVMEYLDVAVRFRSAILASV
jgi:hypothetical protein